MGILLFTFEFAHERTNGASRHQAAHKGTPAWTKAKLHQVGVPIKRHTDLFKYGYIPYV